MKYHSELIVPRKLYIGPEKLGMFIKSRNVVCNWEEWNLRSINPLNLYKIREVIFQEENPGLRVLFHVFTFQGLYFK